MAASRHLGSGPTGSNAIRSADLENPILAPNTKWINQSINQSISKLITRRNLSIRQFRGAEYQWSVECTAV